MISFIIIGRNEGWKLTKCFESVFATIKHNHIKEYEIIYVDSKSTDDSIETAKKFKEIKIFQIIGTFNAAIARNIGAKESNGDVLFFIDGDMEIIPEFLPLIYDHKNGLKYDFVSGQIENNYYDNNWDFLYKESYHSFENDKYQTTTGGLFIIRHNLWKSVEGMRTKYKRSQDLDVGLRLSNIGFKLLRKKELLAKHHTIPYKDTNRMWKMFFKGSEFYRVVLLRDHYKTPAMLKHYIRTNYTSLFLLLSLLISMFTNSFAIIGYFFLVFLRSLVNMKKDIINLPSRIIYFIFRDIAIWFSLIFFWPKEIKKIKYRNVS